MKFKKPVLLMMVLLMIATLTFIPNQKVKTENTAIKDDGGNIYIVICTKKDVVKISMNDGRGEFDI